MTTPADLPHFAPGIFRQGRAGDSPVLLGSGCDRCSRRYFPRTELCPECLAETTDEVLGSLGRIYSFTVVRTKPPLGLPAPYAVGYVDLDGCGLRVFALLDAASAGCLGIGQPVRLAVAPLGHDGQGHPCLRPYFEIVDVAAAV